MAWRRPGAKPLSVPMMFSLLTHIYDTRLQWIRHSDKWPTQIGNTQNAIEDWEKATDNTGSHFTVVKVSTPQYHTWPSVARGIVVLPVDKFPYPRQQTDRH